MSVATYGIIAGNFENQVFEVVDKIKVALKNFEHPHPYLKGKTMKSNWSAEYDLKDSCKGITVDFKDGEDSRMLWIQFDCHKDQKDVYDGEKLILSIGCWGNNEKIIRAMLNEFKGYERYFVPNDYDGEPEKIEG